MALSNHLHVREVQVSLNQDHHKDCFEVYIYQLYAVAVVGTWDRNIGNH